MSSIKLLEKWFPFIHWKIGSYITANDQPFGYIENTVYWIYWYKSICYSKSQFLDNIIRGLINLSIY